MYLSAIAAVDVATGMFRKSIQTLLPGQEPRLDCAAGNLYQATEREVPRLHAPRHGPLELLLCIDRIAFVFSVPALVLHLLYAYTSWSTPPPNADTTYTSTL